MYLQPQLFGFLVPLLLSLPIEYETRECFASELPCKDFHPPCIPRSRLCDGTSDCYTNIDEPTSCNNCDKNSLPDLETGVCVSKCQSLDLCGQKCEMNKNGSHTCSCFPGYSISKENPKKCLLNHKKPSLIFYNEGGRIFRMIPGKAGNAQMPGKFLTNSSMAMDQKYIYISIDHKIQRRLHNFSLVDEIEVGEFVEKISVDFENGNLYLVLKNKSGLSVTSFDSPKKMKRILESAGKVKELAIHSRSGRLFIVTLKNSMSLIYSSNLIGSDFKKLRKIKGEDVTDLIVDQMRERILWIQNSGEKIMSCTFQGTDCRSLGKQVTSDIPSKLAIMNDRLIIFGSFGYKTVDKLTGELRSWFVTKGSNYNSIASWDHPSLLS